MLLMEYAETKNILKRKFAVVQEVRDNGKDVTILYKVDGQRYVNGQPSARTISKEIADKTEVDKDTGRLLSGSIVKKSNFWVWVPEGVEDEA